MGPPWELISDFLIAWEAYLLNHKMKNWDKHGIGIKGTATMDQTLHRRDFLKNSAIATTGTLMAIQSSTHAEDLIPVIDPHQHLWDLTKFRLPWIKKESPLAKSFLIKDYQEATQGLHVVKTVYMEVDVDPEQQDEEARELIRLGKIDSNHIAGAVISGRPASEAFPKYIAAYKDNPFIKGVRQVLHVDSTPRGFCLEKAFIQNIRLLGEIGKSFDLCMRNAELLDAAKLMDSCPETRFVLDHCGNADLKSKDRSQWQKDMGEVAKRKNVICKVSGFVASAPSREWTVEDLAPIVNHTMEVFGPDRVMFAGDWPVCNLTASFKRWLQAVQTIVKDKPKADQRKLFHDNAARFYGIG